MDQTDDITLFINSGQPSAYREYVFDLREVLFIKFELADLDGKTRLTLRQALFESIAARDLHRGGWTECLERFAEYLADAWVNAAA